MVYHKISISPLHDNSCGDFIMPKIRCYFNVNIPSCLLFQLAVQMFIFTLLVGKLSC